MIAAPKISNGVTLLELLITVTVISILAAMAYPSYRAFLDRAGRTEAMALLLEIATNQDRYYLSAKRFGSLAELGYADPLVTASGTYTISVPVATALSFEVIAQYNHSDNERARCASLSINNLGEKTSRGSIGNCWNDRR